MMARMLMLLLCEQAAFRELDQQELDWHQKEQVADGFAWKKVGTVVAIACLMLIAATVIIYINRPSGKDMASDPAMQNNASVAGGKNDDSGAGQFQPANPIQQKTIEFLGENGDLNEGDQITHIEEWENPGGGTSTEVHGIDADGKDFMIDNATVFPNVDEHITYETEWQKDANGHIVEIYREVDDDGNVLEESSKVIPSDDPIPVEPEPAAGTAEENMGEVEAP